MITISHELVQWDPYLDYCPIVSTISNLYIIFQKCVLGNSAGDQDPEDVRHIKNKDWGRCFVCLIPVVGNVIVAIFDFVINKKSEESQNAPEVPFETPVEPIPNVEEREEDLRESVQNFNRLMELNRELVPNAEDFEDVLELNRIINRLVELDSELHMHRAILEGNPPPNSQHMRPIDEVLLDMYQIQGEIIRLSSRINLRSNANQEDTGPVVIEVEDDEDDELSRAVDYAINQLEGRNNLQY